MTPELIAAWAAAAVLLIGAIAAIARQSAKSDGGHAHPPNVSYLVLDAKAANGLGESMTSLAASMSRMARTLDAVVESQDRALRALGANSDAAERVHDAATELRIVMAEVRVASTDLSSALRGTGLPRR